MDTGLPIIATKEDTWRTSLLLHNFNMEVPCDDDQRIDKVKHHNASHIDSDWLRRSCEKRRSHPKMSPPAFRFLLTDSTPRTKRLCYPKVMSHVQLKLPQFVANADCQNHSPW